MGATFTTWTPEQRAQVLANQQAGMVSVIDVGADGSTSAPYQDYPLPVQQAPDPYAKWGGRAAYDSQRAGFNTQKQGIFDTANEAADSSGRQLNSSILDFIDSYRSGQNKINNAGIAADQAKMQGAQDIRGMVGRGIQSGGVMLAGKNATDSSATEAIARAYGDIGTRQMNKVGGQYAEANRNISGQQDELAQSAAQFNRHYQEQKASTVDSIVSAARNSLAALDAQIASASLPDRIAIEQEKERVRNDALGKLNQYDQVLAQGQAGVVSITPEQRAAQAAQRMTEGVQLGDNAFQYTAEAPAQFQGTGPYASNLPLFTLAGRRKES